jgi:hypothetical protein
LPAERKKIRWRQHKGSARALSSHPSTMIVSSFTAKAVENELLRMCSKSSKWMLLSFMH